MADPKPCPPPPLTRASVQAAHARIKSHIHRTPVLRGKALDEFASRVAEGEGRARPVVRLWFKCENLQRVGAFKAKGGFPCCGGVSGGGRVGGGRREGEGGCDA